MTISALPSIICAKVSKGDVFSVSPSPLSKDITLMFPVDFLIMVLLTTELDTYSMISTMICDIDFSSSAVSGFTLIPGLPSLSGLSLLFMFRKVNVINECQPNPQRWVILCSWVLHTQGMGLYDSHFT